MSHKLQFFLLIPGFILLIFTRCEKEPEGTAPVISMISPKTGTSFSNTDSLFIDVSVTDDESIKSVKIGLNNVDQIPAATSLFFFPETRSWQYNSFFQTGENNLEPGIYYIVVRAEDETKYSTEYRQVIFSGISDKEKRLIVITEKDQYSMDVQIEDDFGLMPVVFSVAGDFSASALDPDGNKLFIAGNQQFNLKAYNLDNYNKTWQFEDYSWEPYHNENCLYYENDLYLTYRSYYIQSVSSNGNIGFTTFIENNESPEEIISFDDYLLVDMQKKNAGTPSVAVYYRNTGIEKQRILTTFDVINFHPYGNDNVLIICNNQLGSIYHYRLETNYLYQKTSLTEKITASEKIDGNSLLLGTMQGLLQYNIIQNSLTDILADISIRDILFDKESGKLYLWSDNKVLLYSWPEMENQKTYLFSDSILSLHLQFYK
ncbi:MAG: hypothetical protein KDC05_02190 [Bacteroidales bacterium]|nr:hypothetical protein [Bacteroidales bacterium]